MKYAELHYFSDERFVSDGFTLFLWSTEDDQPFLPAYDPKFGVAVQISEEEAAPELYATYNPTTQTWGTPLADNAVPSLPPFWQAIWNGATWVWPQPSD